MDINVSDEQLVALIGNGDQHAFNQFLTRHIKKMMSFATRYTGKQHAEDITQEVFTRLWTHAHQWKDQGLSPSSWLYRISYNLCIDHIRKQHHISGDNVVELHTAHHEEPEQQVIQSAEQVEVQRALKSLPERQYTALILCTWQELSNKDAANCMDVSVDALESLLSRARRSLKKHLLQHKPDTKDVTYE
ncbi:MAG: sigma-70 family RNA polymerase sigma factor [Gammaproteobacteria bacterium]|nr:sigma-70 family RNA polymerase sigma factor [Gammaproteobacteria bacterium]